MRQLFKTEQCVVMNELRRAEAQLKINSAHAAKMSQVLPDAVSAT